MTNYTDTDPRPDEHPTGVVMRPACGDLHHWVVSVNGVQVGHYEVERDALERQGREVRTLGVTR